MSKDNYTLQIQADITDIKSKLNNLEQSVNQTTTKGESAFSKMGAGVVVFNQALELGRKALQQIEKVYGATVEKAIEQEEIFRELQTAVELTGKSWGEAKGELDGLFASLQATTKYGDTKSAATLKTLIQLTGSYDKGTEALSNVLDLTATGLFNAEAAAKYYALALEGDVSMLGRYIPQLKATNNEIVKNGTAAEKTAEFLRIFNEKFKGTAQKNLESTAAQLKQLKNYLGDIGEAIGDKALPAINKIVGAMARFARSIIESTAAQTALSDGLVADKIRMDALFTAINDVNISTETRNRLIKEINDKYGVYLANHITEKTSLEDIKKAQEDVTAAMLSRISAALAEEEITKIMRDNVKVVKEQRAAQIEYDNAIVNTSTALNKYNEISGKNLSLKEGAALRYEEGKAWGEQAIKIGQAKTRLIEANKAQKNLNKELTEVDAAFKAVQNEIKAATDEYGELGAALIKVKAVNDTVTDSEEKAAEITAETARAREEFNRTLGQDELEAELGSIEGLTDGVEAHFGAIKKTRAEWEALLKLSIPPEEWGEFYANIDKSTDKFKAFEDLFRQISGNMSQAVIYGQDFGEAVVNSLKAISAQVLSMAAVWALMQLIPGGQAFAGPSVLSYIGKGLGFPGFAGGVDSFSGGIAKVHENELVTNLPKGTSVFDKHETADILGGSPALEKQLQIVNANLTDLIGTVKDYAVSVKINDRDIFESNQRELDKRNRVRL